MELGAEELLTPTDDVALLEAELETGTTVLDGGTDAAVAAELLCAAEDAEETVRDAALVAADEDSMAVELAMADVAEDAKPRVAPEDPPPAANTPPGTQRPFSHVPFCARQSSVLSQRYRLSPGAKRHPPRKIKDAAPHQRVMGPPATPQAFLRRPTLPAPSPAAAPRRPRAQRCQPVLHWP